MAEKVLMIALSPTMETGKIARWRKKEQDEVKVGDLLCEVETDKAVMEYESTQEGTLLKILALEGKETRIGDTIAIIGEKGEDISNFIDRQVPVKKLEATPEEIEKRKKEEYSLLKTIEDTGERVRISPLAKKMAHELNIDIHRIQGTGPGGRIIKKDIEQFAKLMEEIAPIPAPTPTAAARIKIPSTIGDEIIPISTMRKIIAERLTSSMYSAPHYYLKVKVNMDELLKARKSLIDESGTKVSLNAFFIKFVSEALKKHPLINSAWNQDSIMKFGRIDIGLAVALPEGLITPIVRDCVSKGILAIDIELKILVDKARNGQLKPEDYNGATFTITNLGSYDIDEFTAIINPPGSAILAVGKIQKEPVVGEDDRIFIRNMMSMTLSCDHRIIDGASGASFLVELKQIMENPIRALY